MVIMMMAGGGDDYVDWDSDNAYSILLMTRDQSVCPYVSSYCLPDQIQSTMWCIYMHHFFFIFHASVQDCRRSVHFDEMLLTDLFRYYGSSVMTLTFTFHVT